MKYCEKCGNELSENSKFCVVCGYEQKENKKNNLYNGLSIASFIMGICSFILSLILLLSMELSKSKITGLDWLMYSFFIFPLGACAITGVVFSLMGIAKESENKYYKQAIIGVYCGILAFIIIVICMFILV